jgi:hypothetical protein
LFRYQYGFENSVYRHWFDTLGVDAAAVKKITDIPFLPISFFKSRQVTTGSFSPELIFESSGTTRTVSSRHLIKDARLYQRSFSKTFELFYGNPKDYCIIGLLPNYLEKGHSSLVKMVHDLIQLSGHKDSGFYLYEFDKLGQLIMQLEKEGQKTLLLGVTFALLDFAEVFSRLKQLHHFDQPLLHTIVMDTGGMKGRKKEMTREEVHTILTSELGTARVHSEYGMTELLSQAYSKGEGKYRCPPYMQILVREETDPFQLNTNGKGLLNVIDMANLHSCCFIATEDVGWVHPDHFEIWGRLDHSDMRGCSLLIARD